MSRQSSEHSAELLDCATKWYLELRDPDVSDQNVARWQGWLAESKTHQSAFDSVVELMQLSCRVNSDLWPDEHELLADQYPDDVPLEHWRNHQSQSDTADPQRAASPLPTSSKWSWANVIPAPRAMAAVACLLAVIVSIKWVLPWPDQAVEYVYQTAAAEHREVSLPDGSMLALGAKSRVVINFSAAHRYLNLEQGEAYFKAARDTSRPFVVVTGNVSVKAIGTAFNINKYRERIIVAVTEGAVSVAPRPENNDIAEMNFDAPSALATQLEKGYQLTLNTQDFAPVTSPIKAGEAVAWRAGYHKYRGESIAQVLQDVNRYKDRPIILTSAAISELRYSGTVFQDSIDSWLLGLEAVFPISVRETPMGDIIIYAKETP